MVPDAQAFAFEAVFGGAGGTATTTRVIRENSLLANAAMGRDTYALQMALKLLVAQIVRTDYYVTLDADVIATGPLCAAALLPGGRGAYTAEPRAVHPHWWEGSATILSLSPRAFPDARFGVRHLLRHDTNLLTTSACRSLQRSCRRPAR